MRTLVVSDLHLGARLERDVLRRPRALEALLDALGDVDRLVLLGDVVELLESGPAARWTAAPVLRAIGARLGASREAVVVPGNHDAARAPSLPRPRRARGGRRGMPPDATPALARLTSWLAPAAAEVRYPGVWLADGIWATHGHYLDRHLMPVAPRRMRAGCWAALPLDGAHPATTRRPAAGRHAPGRGDPARCPGRWPRAGRRGRGRPSRDDAPARAADDAPAWRP